ncbi:uncharacterized protein LOC144449122, partial [Glandiceps talaboti]
QQTCAKSLRKVPGPSAWFNKRFNPRLKLFLGKEDINTWENFYNLTYCPVMPMGFRDVTRRGLIRLVNNANYSTSSLFPNSTGGCIRCAVVGNSGTLKNSKMGAEIDKYDYVFRMNIARLNGYEVDVGSKTHVYGGFPESIYVRELHNFENVYFVTPIFTRFMVGWLESFLNGTIAQGKQIPQRSMNNGTFFNPRMIRILHPDFVRHFHTQFLDKKGWYPSTGGIIAAIATYTCDEIRMFGFGEQNNSTLHYYDHKNTTSFTTGKTNHNFIKEWEVWAQLEKDKLITVYRPNKTSINNTLQEFPIPSLRNSPSTLPPVKPPVLPPVNTSVMPPPIPMVLSVDTFSNDSWLRNFLHIDGPLDLTKANLPNISASVKATYYRPPMLRPQEVPLTCAKSLRKVPGPSAWFNKRFNPRLKLFLGKEDINTWENFYNLTYCPVMPMGFRDVTRRGLIRLVNNANYSTSSLFPNSTGGCIRCAVVGNSGTLKNSKMGAEIDKYDYVFRMNIARLNGYEVDVGSKTHVYGGFPESIYVRELHNFENVYFVTPIFTRFMVGWLESFLNGTIAQGKKIPQRSMNNGTFFNPRMIRILHPDFVRHFHTQFLDKKGWYPSTGGIIAAIATYTCDEIRMFGFGEQNNSTLHYYDHKNTTSFTTGKTNHNFIKEWEIWAQLEKDKLITVYRPNKTSINNT